MFVHILGMEMAGSTRPGGYVSTAAARESRAVSSHDASGEHHGDGARCSCLLSPSKPAPRGCDREGGSELNPRGHVDIQGISSRIIPALTAGCVHMLLASNRHDKKQPWKLFQRKARFLC